MVYKAIITSKFQIELKNFELNLNSNNLKDILLDKQKTIEFEKIISNPKKENTILSKESTIILSLVILKRLKIYKKDITKLKLEDIGKKIDLKLINKSDKFNINFRNLVDDLKLEIKELDLKVEIGTENAMITAFAVAGISTFLSIILRGHIENREKQKFIVIPRYIDELFLKVTISAVFEIDLLHYINSKTSTLKKMSAEVGGY